MFMNEEELIVEAFTKLQLHTGFRWEWKNTGQEVDGTVDLYIHGGREHFTIEVKKELRDYQLAKLKELNEMYKPFMVVADRIFPTLKEKLRENQINYLDTAGNVYIKTGANIIWLDGLKQNQPNRLVTNRAFTKTGLKTVFYLLLHKDAINMPQRMLANATGVALGNIKNVLDGLEDAGFVLKINTKKLQLQNKKVLLDRWIAGYGETLKPALHLGNFRLPPNHAFQTLTNFPIVPGKTVWGGEPAADLLTNYLKPQVLTIYTTAKKNQLMLEWKLLPAADGNIRLYEKFWKDEQFDQHPYAPELLVYADLLLTGDPRCLETAEMIYDKHLKYEFGEY